MSKNDGLHIKKQEKKEAAAKVSDLGWQGRKAEGGANKNKKGELAAPMKRRQEVRAGPDNPLDRDARPNLERGGAHYKKTVRAIKKQRY